MLGGNIGPIVEDAAGEDVRVSESAGHKADQRIGKPEKLLGDSRRIHQLCREDEQGNGHEKKILQAEKHFLRQYGRKNRRRRSENARIQGCGAQPEADRNSDGQQGDEPEGEHINHCTPPDAAAATNFPRISWMVFRTRKTLMTTPESRRTAYIYPIVIQSTVGKLVDQ
jgi:hypothetical protein